MARRDLRRRRANLLAIVFGGFVLTALAFALIGTVSKESWRDPMDHHVPGATTGPGKRTLTQ
jgi:hypothetical protein